jgi:hypothetical protein
MLIKSQGITTSLDEDRPSRALNQRQQRATNYERENFVLTAQSSAVPYMSNIQEEFIFLKNITFYLQSAHVHARL